MYEYFPKDTCSKKITFSIEDNKMHNLHFFRGCDGNLKTLSRLLEGMDVGEAVEKLKGIRCGIKETSCSDQLALAIIEALDLRRKSADRASTSKQSVLDDESKI